MKRPEIIGMITCVALLAVSIALIGGPAAATEANKGNNFTPFSLYRFVGYSRADTMGDAGGPFGMHAICQQSFGARARMCTTEEFWKTPPTNTNFEDTESSASI